MKWNNVIQNIAAKLLAYVDDLRISGVDEETTLADAAKTFISLYSNNPTPVMNSPCAAASQAYIQALTSSWAQ